MQNTFLRKKSHFIIIETDNNDVENKANNKILDELLMLKIDISKVLPNCKMSFHPTIQITTEA